MKGMVEVRIRKLFSCTGMPIILRAVCGVAYGQAEATNICDSLPA